MSRPRSWQIWLVFAGVFLAGAIAGGVISLRIKDRLVERGRGPSQFAPRLVNHLSNRLDLSESQQAEVKALVDRAWEQLRTQRQASRDTMRELDQRIAEVLTTVQHEKYTELQKSRRLRWQELGERRGDGPRRGPEGRRRAEPSGSGEEGPPPPPATQ